MEKIVADQLLKKFKNFLTVRELPADLPVTHVEHLQLCSIRRRHKFRLVLLDRRLHEVRRENVSAKRKRNENGLEKVAQLKFHCQVRESGASHSQRMQTEPLAELSFTFVMQMNFRVFFSLKFPRSAGSLNSPH